MVTVIGLFAPVIQNDPGSVCPVGINPELCARLKSCGPPDTKKNP